MLRKQTKDVELGDYNLIRDLGAGGTSRFFIFF